MTTTEALTVSRMLDQMDGYPGKTVVRVNWRDGGFGLLLVEELKAALRAGRVFGHPSDQIESLEFMRHRHLK